MTRFISFLPPFFIFSSMSGYGRFVIPASHLFELETGEIILKMPSVDLVQLRTMFRTAPALDRLGGKGHARGQAALFAVGLGQQSQDFNQPGFRLSRETGRNRIPLFPGLVDLGFHPLQDAIRFFPVFQSVDGDLPRSHLDDPAVGETSPPADR